MMYQTKKSNMIKKATLRGGLTKHTVMNFINHISISRKIRFNCSKNGRSSDLHHSRTAFPFFQTVAHLECSQTFGAYSYGFSSWFSQDSLLILPKRTVNFAGAKVENSFRLSKKRRLFSANRRLCRTKRRFIPCYGTGSYPLPPHGLQRRMRLIARKPPLNGPYFFIASRAYCEQVGVNRQAGGVCGEMAVW